MTGTDMAASVNAATVLLRQAFARVNQVWQRQALQRPHLQMQCQHSPIPHDSSGRWQAYLNAFGMGVLEGFCDKLR